MGLKLIGRTVTEDSLVVRRSTARPNLAHLSVDLLVFLTELTHALQGVVAHRGTYGVYG